METLKKHGVFNPARVFGVTTLDVVRASTFTAHTLGIEDPQSLKIPVVGGHSGATILPLISQSQPPVQLSQEQIEAITYRRMLTDLLPRKKRMLMIFRCAVRRRRNRQGKGRGRLRDHLHGICRISVSRGACYQVVLNRSMS